ncbi:hypothetical protein ACINWC743_3785 [Acinetobacter sp. WC-743]|nr:hypothetical protein ACINWC743_3785 [Acinetobacter sp. WC-743]
MKWAWEQSLELWKILSSINYVQARFDIVIVAHIYKFE